MNHFIKQRKNFLLYLSILLIAFIPRSIEVLSGNYLFGFDQGLFYEDVREIVENRKLTLIGAEVGGIGGFFQGPGWNYSLLMPYILFRGDPYGGMIFMLLLGIVTVLGVLFLFKNMLGFKTVLFISFFIAIAPGVISQSRFIWPPFVIPPLTVLLIFLVYKSFKRPVLYIPFSIGIIGLMTHFEIATGITLLISTLITLFILSFRTLLNIKVIVFSILAFIATQLSLIIFDLRHNFISSRGILNLLFHNKNIDLPYNFQNHIDIFKDAFLSVSFSLPLFTFTMVVCIMGGILLFKDKKVNKEIKKILIFIVLNTIILFFVFLPMKMTLWSWWILEVPIFLCFIFGIIFSYLWRNKNGRILVLLTLAMYSYLYVMTVYGWYKNDYPDYGGTAKIKGKLDALDYIYRDANGKDFGLLVFTPPVYTYAYDYLLHWYGEKKYGFVPTKEKKDVFYLLMEKDPQKPTSHIGWQETIVVDGVIKKEITLPSGFVIQKRVILQEQINETN